MSLDRAEDLLDRSGNGSIGPEGRQVKDIKLLPLIGLEHLPAPVSMVSSRASAYPFTIFCFLNSAQILHRLGGKTLVLSTCFKNKNHSQQVSPTKMGQDLVHNFPTPVLAETSGDGGWAAELLVQLVKIR